MARKASTGTTVAAVKAKTSVAAAKATAPAKRAVATKATPKPVAARPKPVAAAKSVARKIAAPKAAASTTTKARGAKPVGVLAGLTGSAARTASRAKKSLEQVGAEALGLLPDAPSASTLQGQVGDTVKAIGGQIVGALNSNLGRAMVADLLVYVATSLTSAAAKTDAADNAKNTAKSTILNAGAKIGAAAAEAGAKYAADGKAAIASGADAIAGKTASAKDLAMEVAQVAVGAVGGAVADISSKVLEGKGGRKKLSAGLKAAVESPGPDKKL